VKICAAAGRPALVTLKTWASVSVKKHSAVLVGGQALPTAGKRNRTLPKGLSTGGLRTFGGILLRFKKRNSGGQACTALPPLAPEASVSNNLSAGTLL